MTIGTLHNYLGTPLPLEINARQHFRLLRAIFVLVFASTIAIHLLLQEESSLVGTLVHATLIGLVYTIGIGLVTALLYALRNKIRQLQVWHLWGTSLAGFVLGYYFLPLDPFATWLPGAHGQGGTPGFIPLLPVWLLVTYLFIQPYLDQGLKAELARLQEINALLEAGIPGAVQADRRPVQFSSGRTSFALEADSIRNIAVEDHYCYIHFKQDEGYARRDLAMPIRDVLALLPEGFVQVHRSHIVNLAQVTSLRRKKRNIHVVLDGDCEVPVSRHRLDEVLPLLRQRLKL
jgi:hypothetical protein